MTDYTLEDTIYKKFTTRAFATGIPYTLAGSPVVSAYEDGSVTQITAGITLTVDFDSTTGLNHLAIVATAANGFENGKDYSLVITAGTVDSTSVVGEVVGEFSIGRSAAAVDLANATDGLSALKTLIDTVDTVVDRVEVDTQDLQTQVGTAGAGLTDLGGMSTTMKGQVNTEADTALTDYDPPTNAEMLAATAVTDALVVTVDTVVDGIQTDLSNGTDGLGALKTLIDALATATDLATVDTVVDAIKAVTDQMVFTKANELDVNTKSINDAEVVGDGDATPWDGV